MTGPGRDIGEQLAEWGKVAMLETHGRVSGRQVRTAVGYADEPDGSLLVAAGGPEVDWARNLLADPRCRVTVGPRTDERVAQVLEGDEHARAVTSLILKYGTPAEGLGSGPAFRLRLAG